MSSPNQNRIIINKAKCDRNNLYATINLDALNAAALDLGNGVAFKLWVYFAKNQDGYKFDLSQEAARKEFGIKKTAYHDNIKILKEKGYLTEIKADSNLFSFNEIPIKSPKSEQDSSFSEQISPKSELISSENGREILQDITKYNTDINAIYKKNNYDKERQWEMRFY